MRSAALGFGRAAVFGTSMGATMLIAGVTAPPALAHASLISSSPADGAVLAAPPAAVTLTFDEPVRPVAAEMRVFDPDGESVIGAVTGDGARVVVALPRGGGLGTYTVTWRVISADSHPVGGAFTFSVGHPSRTVNVPVERTDTTVAVLFTLVRFAAFAGFAMLFGTVAFCCYGLPRTIGIRGVRLLIAGGWAVLVAGTFASLLLEGPYGAGAGLGALSRGDLLAQTFTGTYGAALRIRVLMLAVVPFLLAYGLDGASWAGRVAFGGIAAMVMAAIAATWSVGGHAATGTWPGATVPADVAHLCAMALWLGGLAAIAVTMGALRADPGVAAGVGRFSAVAAASVAVLAGTGVYQGWLHVQTLPALLATAYGRLLAVKVTLVGLVLCVAFVSRRTLRRGSNSVVPGRLRRLAAVETAGAFTVLAVTAALVELEPAGKALAARPATLTARYDTHGVGGAGSLSVRLPSRSRGLTTVTVAVRDAAGHARDVPELGVAWSLPGRRIGLIAARVTHAGTGRYVAVAAPLTVTGRWTITVTVRTSDIDETAVTLKQTIQ